MKKWFKIEAKIGSDLDRAETAVFINPDLLGDTVYTASSRWNNRFVYKIGYSNTFVFFTEEGFNSLLSYFRAQERDEKIEQILN